MNLETLLKFAEPADMVLTGHKNPVSVGGVIQLLSGSEYSHGLFYVDSVTIAESTMDFKSYEKTGKRLDNGPQYNHLSNLKNVDYGVLVHFTQVTPYGRQCMLDEIDRIIASKEYMYDITGLFGSLIAYRLKLKKNPLSTGKYCTNFTSGVKIKVLGDDYDPSPYYANNNTSPEMEYQWALRSPDKVKLYYI